MGNEAKKIKFFSKVGSHDIKRHPRKPGGNCTYVPPEKVLSPKSRVGAILEVIHDPGEKRMSVARILWRDKEKIALRWNGSSERPLGNPVSRGCATWFVVDDYAAESVERAARAAAQNSPNGLAAKYREMAADSEREREAEEWSEGLIADGDTPR